MNTRGLSTKTVQWTTARHSTASGRGIVNRARARELGTYEEFREELTALRKACMPLPAIARKLGLPHSRVALMCAVLRIGRRGVPLIDGPITDLGDRRTLGRRFPDSVLAMDEPVMKRDGRTPLGEVQQRQQELALVRSVRQTYGYGEMDRGW